ncbi:uncharacterized protein EV420DRAFT_1484725 [Desarmillaria tabescens]|uniref:Uncharacterized protein n=1 Tax=Armillaria tabescens TaxID=1929756 RepID=A0AA39JMU7_ARMTA|nr:uncharacterized protein EV420DRAFT_1484725 [Desarmillaria tabescens]KAK0444234.1 hypothetical protein EV420DRAFT_1484725 [Desarmillaria tabescens]
MSSTKEAPESYLAILPPSSEQHYDDLFDNFGIKSDERRTLELLDALAGICVSQGEGEVYASAMETSPETCTIFIIGNYEEIPQVTQDYLNDVCRQLTDVAHLADTAGLPRPKIADLSPRTKECIDNILTTVTSFTFDKFLTRLTKWKGPWLKRWAGIDHQLADGAEKNKFQDLTHALNRLYEVSTPHVRHVKTVVGVLASISRSWKLSDRNTSAFIRGLDLLPTSDTTDAPFFIERYLRKVLKTFNETSKLIRFAVSPRRGHIFRNQPKLVFLRSERRHVELDIKTAIKTVEHHMETIDPDRVYFDQSINNEEEQLTYCPHCECAMLATLLQQRPSPIIGVSKLSCFGCRLYFIAYRMARIFQSGGIDLPKEFVVTRASNTLCLPWVSPDLTSIDPDLHSEVQQQLLILTRGAAIEHALSLDQCSESTTYWLEGGVAPIVNLSLGMLSTLDFLSWLLIKSFLEDIERNWMAKMNISS